MRLKVAAICLAVYAALRTARTHFLFDAHALHGRCVVITGASTGFGRAIALKLHSLGAVVYAGCNRQVSVDEIAAEFPGDTRMRPIKLNVAKDDEVAAAVSAVQASGVPLLAVINNAGVSAFGWAEVLPVERHAFNVDVNYVGTVRMTRAFLPMLRENQGRLINMGSIGARMPAAFGSSYLPAKAAMLSYSDCVRQEVFRHGVKVVYIEPGFFETSLLTSARANGATHAAAVKAPPPSSPPEAKE
jgi:NAD(P)-dependent dehydrogenase (short-subunit alcohol dehydrogenase family)